MDNEQEIVWSSDEKVDKGQTSNAPKKVGLPETDMVKSKLCEIESVYEASLFQKYLKTTIWDTDGR